ncbi:caM kinase-like vesicle-associated protein isoform X1 [Dunckerocampus dactyliophorus]|uniref:caM kinase-like vesicle-associated protein isoform X1 n=1 Tax=Dunckerocampus dactyliophorus TaxID=161453 RepID=UPI0024065311|nr:caM kinase-like vesicle-associated protein isoform X1 [Dunckerocampus dactyliophorus]XP_054642328.1 caM kinase-like vesicle-associated protein isoform X1 [Dunckerocampus dactyliophorus]
MPFGCLALREGRTYDSISDVTDKYEIGQVLRAKEFCELCLAKDRQTDKVFVCKKFLKKDGRKVRKAAKNEIMILKLVNHPNILQLIDTFETRKEYFIIQELATGGDVFDWIQDQGNYTEKDASSVIRQVLEAVAYLHSLNIVHRNLKLENLMYYTENNHNKVVLRDFYLSRFENGPITEPCGTPEYLAPEVVARHRYGRPVDCWAVGVIMFILLSGNPPFYDETEEENTDLHNRIIFCRIVAGDFEFDSPYWDDISPAAKQLVCRLMEVDQMLRITAQDALWHEWIAGNGASEKNLKDGVCAQFEKNFAKAKWRKAIRVTTFMQRLKNSESVIDSSAEVKGEEAGEVEGGVSQVASNNGGSKVTDGGMMSSGVSLDVMVENRPAGVDQEVNVILEPSAEAPPSSEKFGTKKAPANENRKTATDLDQNKESKINPLVTPEHTKLSDSISDPHLDRKQTSTSPDPNSKLKMAATLHGPPPTASASATQKDESDGSWCQTQIPEAVAESSVGAAATPAVAPGQGVDASLGVSLRLAASPALRRDGDARKTDRYSAEFNIARAGPPTGQGCYAIGSSASLGRHATPFHTDIGTVGMGMAGPYGSPYSTLYASGRGGGMYGTGLHHGEVGSSTTSDWQMDSVIEQIEKQMVAVLEKIEGDMPSLLEQISDCPSEPLHIRSTQASPATSRARTSQHSTETSGTPPPLPKSPRPALPSLPRLTIPPPSYPPPSPPTQASVQATGEQLEKGGQRGAEYCSHSSGAGMSRGL